MRVLVYAPCIGYGGHKRLVECLIREMAQAPDVSFTALAQAHTDFGTAIDWPCPLIQLDPGLAPTHPELFFYLDRHVEVFSDHLKRVAPAFDVVWVPWPYWVMRSRDFEWPIPAVLNIHDFAFDRFDMGAIAPGMKLETHLAAASGAFALFSCNAHRQYGIEHYGFRPERSAVIEYGGFLPPNFTPTDAEADRVRVKYHLPDNYLLAFHSGYHKGVLDVLPAHHLAQHSNPLVGALVLAGANTRHYLGTTGYTDHHIEDVRRLILMLGYELGRNLFVLGAIANEDLGGLYKGARASLVGSKSDAGLSATMFESIEAGTPLIYSNLPEYTERLPADFYGRPYAAGDVHDLSCAIQEVYSEADLFAVRAKSARTLVGTRGWTDIARDYLDVFRALCPTP